ncbi:hypothetical protein [Yinghuangia soli]|uniref:Uncharacterized protein n=1 Tax=Yinghuangia soli TaxID=2908204 RepID=A0AA41Q1C1_9ACTN|nr:hypothetical protein [Yinghuangia soli]MCF2529744.1 hypothetical protein [Yinghuangia soli]
MAVAVRARSLLISAASVLVLGAALPATAVADTEPQAAAPRWTAGKFPDGDAVITGTAKVDRHTTWASGFKVIQNDNGTTELRPVAYAQDDRTGPEWKELPTAPDAEGRFNAIAVNSPRDAWLVGDSGRDGGPVMTQHWDGKAWKQQPAPMPEASSGGGLLDIVVVAPDNVWAVGWAQVVDQRIPDPDGGPTEIVDHHEGVVQHWNGQAWNRIPVPQPFPSWTLSGISASSPDDIWAVGNGYGDNDVPVVLHYDGSTWTATATPPFGGLYGEFYDVVANGPQDVWAVGRVILDEKDRGHALVMHWDGRTWQRIEAAPDAGRLTGVAKTPGGIVAVGETHDRESGYALRVQGTRVSSLGIPLTSDGGTVHWTWQVSATGREVTVNGAFNYAKAPADPKPMVLTGRL